MKTLEKYVFGSFLSSFALAFVVLSFVLTIGLLVQIVGYILDGMPAALVGKFAAVSFPETLQWTIPLALLVSSVLVFSRLSADSEIAAMRACGVNLLSVMKYPAIFAAASSLLCMWVNNEIVPRGHEVRRQLASRISVGNAVDFIVPGMWITDFPGYRLYAAAQDGAVFYDVTAIDSNASPAVTYRAESVVVSGQGRDVKFELKNVTRTPIDENNPGTAFAADLTQHFRLKEGAEYKKKAKDLRFFEMLDEISRCRAEIAEAKREASASDDAALKRKVKSMKKGLSKTKVELSKRFAFALASLCFVLVGVPLGIRAQRKESTIGMAISLAIALGFYLFIMLMLSLQKSYAIHPEVLIFLPIGACLALAGWFVKRNL